MSKQKMTITDVTDKLGVTAKTVARWEKTGKIGKPKRDWRGWHTYNAEDFKKIEQFKETIFIEDGQTEEKGTYATARA